MIPAAQVPRAVPSTPPVKSAVPASPAARMPLSAGDLAELQARVTHLDLFDYFQVLRISEEASPTEIKHAFHQESRTFHPDRFFHVTDEAFKAQVNELYKRVTEAYYVLRDDRRRAKYLADIRGPDRDKKLRFDEAAEAESKAAVRKEQEEQIGTTPKGRQFFQTGMAEFDAGRWAGAERNFKMALTYEPQNPRYKAKFEEARAKLEETTKKSGPDFRIK
jgi:DnaJ-class molecular chaperone